MQRWPEDSALRAVQSRMQAAARRVRLPLRNRTWRGEGGNWQGAGVGSSIDFQDHRPYLPGDDPRYIDWQAYARTGHYSMKLYREEVSPRVDVALDVSESMFFDDAKRERSLELFFFCAESALQAGSSLRCHAVGRADSVPWTPGAALRESERARISGPPSVDFAREARATGPRAGSLAAGLVARAGLRPALSRVTRAAPFPVGRREGARGGVRAVLSGGGRARPAWQRRDDGLRDRGEAHAARGR